MVLPISGVGRRSAMLLFRPAVIFIVVLASVLDAHAACNLIPSASRAFRGTLGDLNRPFAAPGDFVEVGVSPSRCGGASPGFAQSIDDQIVSVVFEPPGGGERRVVFITSQGCGSLPILLKQGACEAVVGAGRVACVQAGPSNPTGLNLVDRNGERRLSFRFPDTDALFAPDVDARTASGPATIAVSPASAPLPCELATTTCDAQPGLIACVDRLFAADGSCDPVPGQIFPSFTALPRPNDFQAACFTDDPPCTGLATETRLAVDGDGNLLLPVHWSGVLIRQNDLPVPRLIRATIKSPLPFPVPDATFLASYTPEGAKLPPIFEPQSDPSITDPDVITLFGSADASYTILRFARRAGRCAGGAAAGAVCSNDKDCPGGTCPTTCVGGSSADAVCTADVDCPDGGRCGALFADYRPLAAYGGPLPLRRQAAGSCLLPPHAACTGPGDCPGDADLCVGAGICQLEPHGPCATNADCPGDGNACVSYALEATTAIPLESLTAGSPDVFSFTVNESTRLSDDDGDGDNVDSVVTLRNRETGKLEPMGAPLGCPGVTADAEGRAVVRISDPPFAYPAVEAEGDVVAFLESESAEGYCDQTADGDRLDALLRVFALGGGERTSDPAPVADTALLVNDQALAVSNGLVFYRRPERGPAPNVTTRASLALGGGESVGNVVDYDAGNWFDLSADGRYVFFESHASDLVADDTNVFEDAFVYDRQTGITELVSRRSDGTPLAYSLALAGAMSADGRYVAFGSLDPTVVPGDTNDNADVFVRDRVLGTTERVTLSTSGDEGTGGPAFIVGADAVDISADGRFVLFYSQYTNLVPNDTNDATDLFVRDRLLNTTERVTLRNDGMEAPNAAGGTIDGAISADGRFVAFRIGDNGMVGGETNFAPDVYVRDRLLGRTELVSIKSDGTQADGISGHFGSLDISDDGRFVVFSSEAALVPSDDNFAIDVYVHDRLTGITELASVATGGVILPGGLAPFGSFGVHASISGDGRWVTWTAPDAANAVPGDTNGFLDAFVHDRQTGTTERVSLAPGGVQAVGGDSVAARVSADGSTIAFKSAATNLVAGDTLGFVDAFARTVDPGAPGLDLFPDGEIDDTVLEVFDPATQATTPLCPAGQAAVAAGRVAFLRPESAAGTPACPGGSLNDPFDGDTTDRVVQMWEPGGPVVNHRLPATRVALSSTHVAALVDEAAQGFSPLNGDGDAADTIVHVQTIGTGTWTNVGEAADTLAVCGTLVPFITPEAAQGADRDGDGNQDDRVLQIWDTAGAGTRVNTQRAAEEFVCGASLIAFRSPESGTDRNDDGDGTDDVLEVYDTTSGVVHHVPQAIVPCGLAECDPREPYRVLSRSVKFLTLEAEQGGRDLNGDGDAADLVIQTFDVDTGVTKVIGTVRNGANPFAGGETGTPGQGTVYVSTGRCFEPLGGFCVQDGECGPATFCWNFGCVAETGVCATDGDCSPGSQCAPSGIVPASPDGDADGVPDHLDNCPDTGPADQTDTDGDGVGDVCDVASCHNGVVDGAEQCDGADDAACPGACTSDCRCCPEVADPKAVILMNTLKDAGTLTVKMSIPLGSYADAPVGVELVDTDSDPIVATGVGTLAPKGKKGVQWAFKVKTLGLQQVSLKDDTKKHPGMFKVVAKAKRWFTSAQANQSAADSSVRLTVGGQCFAHVVTKKK